MIDRTKEFWLVALFLSRFTDKFENKPVPPIELNTTKWREAYCAFYERLSQGRSLNSFELSLRNARDSFDGHVVNSPRVGWRDKEGNPQPLIRTADVVFRKYIKRSRNEIWEEIKELADINVKHYLNEFEDVSAMQCMEFGSETQKISLTEGGLKVLISVVSERNPRLRSLAFKAHGYKCRVCEFDFSVTYGDWGAEFAEVHHIIPLSQSGQKKRMVDPVGKFGEIDHPISV